MGDALPRKSGSLEIIILLAVNPSGYESTVSQTVMRVAKFGSLSGPEAMSAVRDRKLTQSLPATERCGRPAELAREVPSLVTRAGGFRLFADRNRGSRDGKQIPRSLEECCGQWRETAFRPGLR